MIEALVDNERTVECKILEKMKKVERSYDKKEITRCYWSLKWIGQPQIAPH